MPSTLNTSVELPEGYSIIERLGAGGYGEVWKATAPGGIEKALKVVFGHFEEEMAERELKSLDRIKSVRHPFLLSIERYEIVAGRLVIVSELADESLHDCCERHRSEGRPGVPRDQLLAYLRDAAEALDCLAVKHGLLHLDVKPENLLVIDDHAKVADFGLVKELAARTIHSMVGGMTPVYSGPEVFDDKPAPQSDQYSLAIVYQQMLTGVLPFPGRTPAQLAKQHTLSPPNLQPLPEADRAVVGRALHKAPQERFGTCVEFINALLSDDSPAPSPSSSSSSSNPPPATKSDPDDTASVCSLRTTPNQAAPAEPPHHTQPIPPPGAFDKPPAATPAYIAPDDAPLPEVSSEVKDIATDPPKVGTSAAPQPTLYIAAGGVGQEMLMRLRQRLAEEDEELLDGRHLSWLAIDTDRESLTNSTKAPFGSLPIDDSVHTPLRRPKAYRDVSNDLLRWVSRRWLYNIPRSLTTRGYRPLGRIALVDNTEKVLAAIDARLRDLDAQQAEGKTEPTAIRVVILAGMSGGTGSGIVIDLGQAARNLAAEAGVKIDVHALLGCTHLPTVGDDPLAAANMFSFLTELCDAQGRGNMEGSATRGAPRLFESSSAPFDVVYTTSIPHRADRSAHSARLNSIAEYLAIEATTAASQVMRWVRERDMKSDDSWERTFACLNLARHLHASDCNHFAGITQAVVRDWLRTNNEAQVQGAPSQEARTFGPHASSHFANTVLNQLGGPLGVSSTQGDDELTNRAEQRRQQSITRIAEGFQAFCEAFHSSDDHDRYTPPAELVAELSLRIVESLCRTVRSDVLGETNLAELIAQLLHKHVQEVAATTHGDQASDLLTAALDSMETKVLDCGHRRRSLLLGSVDPAIQPALAGLSERLPTLCVVANSPAEPSLEARLVVEGIGLSPRHLAVRLAENLPNIAEAAGRLHAREDIPWRNVLHAEPEQGG